MICENCNNIINKIYGSGRFCSKKCARSFSTKSKRKEINEKVSKKLKGKKSNYNPSKIEIDKFVKRTHTESAKFKRKQTKIKRAQERILNTDFSLLGKTQIRKRIILEQKNRCAACNINSWQELPITLELEHKDGNKNNNCKENLIALCPNCHSQTFSWRRKKSSLIDKL